jgi:glutamine synthetase
VTTDPAVPPARPETADDLLARLEADGIERLWVVYRDYLGRGGGKVVPRESFQSAVRGGVVFARANLDFDHADHQLEGAEFLADSGDFLAVPDPRSYVPLPQFPHAARVHAHLREDDGAPWDGCPRTRLADAVDGLAAAGYRVMAALEPEFYLVRRDAAGDLHPVSTNPMFSAAGLAAEEPFLRRTLDLLAGMGVAVPQIGQEYSPGQYELSTSHADPLGAVDAYYAVREAVRDAAAESGCEATFMPKPYAGWSGNSLHVHLSVWDRDGRTDLTPEPTDQASLSDLGRHAVGGILAHVEALVGLGSPTVNSYKRLQPASWAPAHATWGVGNRSGVVRIPGHGRRRHLEYRASDNTAQPELLLVGLLAAVRDGIERRIEPAPPTQRDVGHMGADDLAAAGVGTLPRALAPALDALEGDPVVGGALGPTILRHTLALRRAELDRYEREVHAWERDTYARIV